jgi:hypothetical protein
MKKIILIMLCISCYTNAQVPSYVPTNGLVGYWPFNGNANDESGNGNNGVVNGAKLTNDRFGNARSSYNFNGTSSYIRINSSASLNSQSVSISGWFKTNNLPTNDDSDAKGIISKWWQNPSVCNANYNAYLVNLNKPSSQNSTCVGGATSFYAGNEFYANSGVAINNWYHFVFVHNSSTGGKLYINAKLFNSNSLIGSICNSLNAINIGADINNGNLWRFFNGEIDDIGIWSRALTQDEITNLHNSANTNECLTMVINTGVLNTTPVTYASSVNIYPNPTNDQITIDCGNLANVSGWSIKITNMLGQEVFNQPMNTQQYVVPLNTWSGQGMYFVKIINAQNEVVNIKKIILQ